MTAVVIFFRVVRWHGVVVKMLCLINLVALHLAYSQWLLFGS